MKIYSKKISDTKYRNIREFIPFPKERALYIDIETTGFSRKNDMIYLVGLLYFQDDQMMITQYLCQKPEDEYELLFKLNTMMNDFDVLVHFNGDSFDLPFIKERMKLYRMHENLSQLESFDYYRKIKPMKKLLQTDNFKLKTLERICGYDRVDPFTGGELIALYKKYLDGDGLLEMSFITHNEEDMIGLYHLNAFLPIISVLNHYTPTYFDLEATQLIDNSIHIPFHELCKPLQVQTYNLEWGVTLSELGIHMTFNSIHGEKKLYFDDYKSYYYLPEEDMAVHESVAGFMSSKYRKKATPKTAYIKRDDLFVYVPFSKTRLEDLLRSDVQIHVFNDEPKDSHCYIMISDLKIVIQYILDELIATIIH